MFITVWTVRLRKVIPKQFPVCSDYDVITENRLFSSNSCMYVILFVAMAMGMFGIWSCLADENGQSWHVGHREGHTSIRGSQGGGLQKSGFGGSSLDPKNRNEGANKKTRPTPQNMNEGTKKRNDGTQTGTRAHDPFQKNAKF